MAVSKEPDWIDELEKSIQPGVDPDDVPIKICPDGDTVCEAFMTGYREGLLRAFHTANDSYEEILKVIDEQSNDEGIWFLDGTPREEYLQKAFRRLQGVIEFEFGDEAEEEADED
jgi:hypothetical protein